jgi:hypothetical protein
MKYYKTTAKIHLDTLSAQYNYQVISPLILYASRNVRVWWCVDTDVQHRLLDRMVNGKSGVFTVTAFIIPIYDEKRENRLFSVLKGRKLVNVPS